MPEIDDIAALWGQLDGAPEFVAARENSVYHCRIDGQSVALRLHRPGYQSYAAIQSELRWCARLADLGFPCPRPVVSDDGSYLRSVHLGGHASVVSWLDGAAIGAGDTRLQGSEAEQAALYHAVGALLAALHQATDVIQTEDLQRGSWDADTLLGEAPIWGRFWENPTLTRAEADLLLRTKARAYDLLVRQETIDAGLIHADPLQENILATPAGLALIDFDDGGFGYRAYDLGVALSQHWDTPNADMLRRALLDGYATLRPAPAEDLVILFTMVRALASCGWCVDRCAGDSAVQRQYAQRAVTLADQWMAQTTTA